MEVVVLDSDTAPAILIEGSRQIVVNMGLRGEQGPQGDKGDPGGQWGPGVLFGTGDPPDPTGLSDGVLYFKYV
jgi:hypothetical protein